MSRSANIAKTPRKRIFSHPAANTAVITNTWLNRRIGSNRHPWIINIPLYNKPIVAKKISNLIKKKEKLNQKCVLGLSTGSSPLKTYSELIKMHKKEGLSFKNVVVFNLDEFYPMKPNSQFSYHSFMFNKFLKYIVIQKKNINIPKG